MWRDISKKELKEAETEARLKALEDEKEQRRLKEVGGFDAYSFSFWVGTDYSSMFGLHMGHPVRFNKALYIRPRGGYGAPISDFFAKQLRDMLLREFPVETQAQPSPDKKAGRK